MWCSQCNEAAASGKGQTHLGLLFKKREETGKGSCTHLEPIKDNLFARLSGPDASDVCVFLFLLLLLLLLHSLLCDSQASNRLPPSPCRCTERRRERGGEREREGESSSECVYSPSLPHTLSPSPPEGSVRQPLEEAALPPVLPFPFPFLLRVMTDEM